MVSFFSEYFGFAELTTENIILYSLRIISVGSMAFFGMAVNEVILLQHNLSQCEASKKSVSAPIEHNTHSNIILEEAKLKAEKMVYEAEKKCNDILSKKDKFESRLKELITAERELIKKYENNENE